MKRMIKLLHLEDNALDAELIHHTLRAGGLHCDIELVSHKLAYETQLTSQTFDLVLIDFNLPDYNGLSALEFSRNTHPDLPVIFISGTIGEEDAVECLKAGANDYVLKQRLQRLCMAVMRALKDHADYLAKQHAERTAENEKRFSSMMIESTPGILYFYDDKGQFLRWNRNFEVVSGYSSEEIATMHPLDFFSGDEKTILQERIKIVFDEGESSVEAEFVSKSGKSTPYFFTGKKVVYNGKDCLIGVGIDITKRKLIEEDLRIAATAFKSQQGILVTDAQNIILRVNDSFTKITGYSAEEAVGKTASLLNSGKHDTAFYQQMWKNIIEDQYWHGEIWNRRKSGELYPEWLTISSVLDVKGNVTNYVGSFLDISDYKAAEEKIELLAFYDPLTNLPNRRLFQDRLQHAIADHARHLNFGCLLFIDLDHFKNLNDTKGHSTGDLLLLEVAKRLSGCVRATDTVARLGGDEFVILLENIDHNMPQSASTSQIIAEKILAAINQPVSLNGFNYQSSASIGICLFGHQEMTVDEILRRADTAMYQAKSGGRNALRFYDPAMQKALEYRTSMENDLRCALAKKQLKLYYQMQLYQNGHIFAAEVLLRWEHPEHGLISPLSFIPLAEETGLIIPIGKWVLESACKQLKIWENHTDTKLLRLAVNVSALQFHEPDFVDSVTDIISRCGIEPDRLDIELTESIAAGDVNETIKKMRALKSLGVRFSMDDFGTGYSSLSYLTKLPLDQLKIDQSFVRNILDTNSDATIVKTIIGMASNLGMEIIAEGVETEHQRLFLEQNGCSVYQGYLFSKPVPLHEFMEQLKKAKM